MISAFIRSIYDDGVKRQLLQAFDIPDDCKPGERPLACAIHEACKQIQLDSLGLAKKFELVIDRENTLRLKYYQEIIDLTKMINNYDITSDFIDFISSAKIYDCKVVIEECRHNQTI